VLAAGALAAAHALLARFGRVPPVVRALVYAAAIVVAAHVTSAIVAFDGVSSSRETFGGESERAVVQILSSTEADVAWQAGLLFAAAALILRRPAAAA
jgi:hypothetical protein